MSADNTVVREGLHRVGGTTVPCCEEGETDCPCTCHGEAAG